MSYFGMSIEELKSLGAVSGEAVRLYLAVSSFAYGSKVECHPMWYQLADRMGRPIIIDHEKTYKTGKKKGDFVPESEQRKSQKRYLLKLAIQLEKAGLVRRGKFGKRDRWELVMKKQLISEKRKASNKVTMVDQKEHPRGDFIGLHGRTNTTPLNTKRNNKENTIHNIKKEDTEDKSIVYIYNNINNNNRSELYISFFKLVFLLRDNLRIKDRLKLKSILNYFSTEEWNMFDIDFDKDKENYQKLKVEVRELILKIRKDLK